MAKAILTLELLFGHVVELDTSNDCSLLYVRVHVMKTLLDCLLKILGDTLKSEGTQTSQS